MDRDTRQRRYEQMLANSATAAVCAGPDGLIVSWNTAAHQLLGHSSQVALGQPLAFIIPERFRVAHDAGMIRAVQTGRSRLAGQAVEILALHANGTEIPIDLSLSMWFEEGKPMFGALMRDNADRKHAEEALRERETQFKKTLDHIPQMVWSTSPDGYNDYNNSTWYEFTGVPEESALGDGWKKTFHPDDLERACSSWDHSLVSGEPYEIEYRLRHHTGVYRWVLVRSWPERDDHGEIVRWYGTCTDIHERVRAREALLESKKVQESVLESSADSIKIILADGTVEFINGPGLLAKGWGTLASVKGKKWISLWPKDGQSAVQEALDRARSGQVSRFSGFCPTASGIPKWWDVVVTPIKDEQGQVTRFLSISRDITAQRESARQLKWASQHDHLTGLPNRRALETTLQDAISRNLKLGGKVTLFLLDLDHFKHVNDTLGHVAGDHLLCAFGQRLRDTIGPDNFVARLGGDEFAIILESPAGGSNPLRNGQAILDCLKHPVEFDGRYISAGTSIGGAVFPRDASNSNELFKFADIALHALKNSGRGGLSMFHSHMREETQIAASQLSLARGGINIESVEPHYQPKVDLKTGRIVGMEALLRWRHPSRGLQTPNTVAEAFNDYELAAKIGDIMQRKVMSDLRDWNDLGLPLSTVSINAAPAEFLRDDFAECLFERMAEHSIRPSQIEIEVTEHVFVSRGADIVGRALRLMDRDGIRIALDDFGTGHSSLSHLRYFPVDVVKIDRSFIEGIADDQGARAIVSAIIGLARNLNFDVVAEGIENEIQQRLLVEEGCGFGQGYYFGKAVSAEEIVKLIQRTPNRAVA